MRDGAATPPPRCKPAVGPNSTVHDKMSLNTLLEAAKYLELQEQRKIRATQDTALATPRAPPPIATAAPSPVHTVTTQAFDVQSCAPNVQQQPPPAAQTVVISSSNISSTLLQRIHSPITYASVSPTVVGAQPASTSIRKEQDGHISSTTMTQSQRRAMQNSFDIMNPLVIDEAAPTEQKKYKQPPMVFRSGTREVHNKLEKCRRAHLKECFDALKKQLPNNGEEKKTSNLSILHSALKYIQALKRREAELEQELEQLARQKMNNQQRLAALKKECHLDHLDFSNLMPEIPSSTSSLSLSEAANSPSASTSSMSPNAFSPSFASAPESFCDDVGNDVTIPTPGSVASGVSSSGLLAEVSATSVINQPTSVIAAAHGDSKLSIPILGKPIASKEVAPASGISVLPMTGYPVNQGLVLQKVAIVPHKGLSELTPLVSTHFITTPQQLNGINGQISGKVVPLTQYIVKPMVVVSSANQRPSS
ncbi:hypothetical protein HUJ05_011022 [Dendroctonus ponderosae]|nr:hypothetical protein HUJ05_011022 [Dendroctonus ponderosae]